jgi:hypothetical protein
MPTEKKTFLHRWAEKSGCKLIPLATSTVSMLFSSFFAGYYLSFFSSSYIPERESK